MRGPKLISQWCAGMKALKDGRGPMLVHQRWMVLFPIAVCLFGVLVDRFTGLLYGFAVMVFTWQLTCWTCFRGYQKYPESWEEIRPPKTEETP